MARAHSVVEHLVEYESIAASRLTAVGLGSSQPRSRENSEEAKSQNNRVEIVLGVTEEYLVQPHLALESATAPAVDEPRLRR